MGSEEPDGWCRLDWRASAECANIKPFPLQPKLYCHTVGADVASSCGGDQGETWVRRLSWCSVATRRSTKSASAASKVFCAMQRVSDGKYWRPASPGTGGGWSVREPWSFCGARPIPR